MSALWQGTYHQRENRLWLFGVEKWLRMEESFLILTTELILLNKTLPVQILLVFLQPIIVTNLWKNIYDYRFYQFCWR